MKVAKIVLTFVLASSLIYSCTETTEQQSTLNDSTSVTCDSVCTDSTQCKADSACVDTTK
jgi:hypothetical protein